jgi:hypothetical protein
MAKLAGKANISVDEMSQEVDLKRYLKREPTTEEKMLFAELAIEQINQRTLDGKTIHGGKFKKYSKTYADLKGVSRDSVDLFLEGNMLNSLAAQETSKGVKIVIDDDLDTKKGFNHHTGDTTKKRPWFGLTTDEVRSLAEQVKQPPQQQEQGFTLADLQAALAQIGLEQVD